MSNYSSDNSFLNLSCGSSFTSSTGNATNTIVSSIPTTQSSAPSSIQTIATTKSIATSLNTDASTKSTASSAIATSVATNTTNSTPPTPLKYNNKIVLDVAVLCKKYTTIEKICDEHIVNLDDIPLSLDLFQKIFYPYCDTFGLNKDFILHHQELLPLISFLPEYRTIHHKKFYLLEELIANIETDLNISRNCFTKDSLVELTNEIIGLKSMMNLNCCSVLSSLTWSNILELIENYRASSCNNQEVVPILVVNITFNTPTPGVKNTLVRFHYLIEPFSGPT